MVNSTTKTSADIPMNGEKLEEVTSLKFLGATLWTSISFHTIYSFYKSLVVSILLFGCET
ncbi:hypothetical protein DPMN_127939 [Dreissena polymorpha]|uniref:Uncharacterized protein n=1 Tax=Dreissena polymorpha TaxID=45954 RepID=A0A9D4H238_DREPO|nr:hypothetical protein DPMN_127939 [Dreissena polymorpha]